MQFSHHFRKQPEHTEGVLPPTTFGDMTVQEIANLIEREHRKFFPSDLAPQITTRFGSNRSEPVRHYTTHFSDVGKNTCYIDAYQNFNNRALESAL
jgi:hypothetical protein